MAVPSGIGEGLVKVLCKPSDAASAVNPLSSAVDGYAPPCFDTETAATSGMDFRHNPVVMVVPSGIGEGLVKVL